MTFLVRVAATALALVFAWAAIAKLRSRQETAGGFADLGLPVPAVAAVGVPIFELVIAGLLLLSPPWGGALAFATLVGFTVYLAGLVRSGRPVSCRCFGEASNEPVSGKMLWRNGFLLVLAAVAAVGG